LLTVSSTSFHCFMSCHVTHSGQCVSTYHVPFTGMLMAWSPEPTTRSMAWPQASSRRTSTRRWRWQTGSRLALCSSTRTTRPMLPHPLVASNSQASAKTLVCTEETSVDDSTHVRYLRFCLSICLPFFCVFLSKFNF